jgi:hypothetical protein
MIVVSDTAPTASGRSQPKAPLTTCASTQPPARLILSRHNRRPSAGHASRQPIGHVLPRCDRGGLPNTTRGVAVGLRWTAGVGDHATIAPPVGDQGTGRRSVGGARIATEARPGCRPHGGRPPRHLRVSASAAWSQGVDCAHALPACAIDRQGQAEGRRRQEEDGRAGARAVEAGTADGLPWRAVRRPRRFAAPARPGRRPGPAPRRPTQPAVIG